MKDVLKTLGAIAVVLGSSGCRIPPTLHWTIPVDTDPRHCWTLTGTDVPLQIDGDVLVRWDPVPGLRAYRAKDGRLLWRRQFGDDCVVVHGTREGFFLGVLTRGGRTPSPTDTWVLGLGVAEGRTRWRTAMPAYPLPGLPAIDGARAYLATRRHRHPFLGKSGTRGFEHAPYDPDHRLRAFDIRTGVEAWSQAIPGPEGRERMGRIEIHSDGDRVFLLATFGFEAWSLSAFEAGSGGRLWTKTRRPPTRGPDFDLNNRAGRMGILSDGRLAHVRRSRIDLHDPRTGAVTAPPQLDRAPRDLMERSETPLVRDDAAYFFSALEDVLVAVDLRTGTEMWRRGLPSRSLWKRLLSLGGGSLSPGYRAGRVSVGARNGQIHVLDARTGRLQGRIDPYHFFEYWTDDPAIPYADGVILQDASGMALMKLRRWF